MKSHQKIDDQPGQTLQRSDCYYLRIPRINQCVIHGKRLLHLNDRLPVF